ncbi:acyl-CoA dehydrogenase [Sphingomonas crocodyli]|uniref:Acyl-CoA dehydrogenase n=1 Tax=Sphingomonas crocodyli TaxID=1979270 RepID=A0A437LVG5_9SPHN|nr:acyl-CoA dehydrogenase [Sphingomonas crocodyli]RVT89415.1 acyl-CoA dehydrogenase [Sphingomonas crocodyli]
MNLALTDEQVMLVETFRRFFEDESTIARVRANEALGHDPALLKGLGELGALGMRLPGEGGDADFGLFDVALILEEAGRTLASAPIVEVIVAARLLAQLGGQDALLADVVAGDTVVTLATAPTEKGVAQLIPGGAVASGVLHLVGDEVRLASVEPANKVAPNHGSLPIATMVLDGDGPAATVIAKGDAAKRAYLAVVEEWKLLTAAFLSGLGGRSIEMAAEYARERKQFDRLIGSFQGVAHPLADRHADMVGAKMLVWSAVRKIADRDPEAAATVSMAFWWAAKASGEAVARALHTFGGYGLTNEYDIQLYHRRAKGIALQYGDPRDELLVAGKRLFGDTQVPLPEAGPIQIDFEWSDAGKALRTQLRDFFEKNLTPEWHAKAHYSFDGHDVGLNMAMGKERLLFPDWPVEHGGMGLSHFDSLAGLDVWDELGVTAHAQNVTNFIGSCIMRYGSDWAKKEILPKLASGEKIVSLGYSEPSSGSDIFAAKTKAVRDGDDWVINGQKMFTSGANLASWVMLLTRTDPDAPKHAGITMFLVPLDDKGVEIHPVFTFQEERTNATFYSDVRISDDHRLGAVGGGTEVLGFALSLEQGGYGFFGPHKRLYSEAVAWAKSATRHGRPALENDRIVERLAQSATHVELSRLTVMRALWQQEKDPNDRGTGPMSKLFSSELFLRDGHDLLDLAAPDTQWLGKHGTGELELLHRHAAATTIYGGTSEVQRSQVAEKELGLPRSR